MFMQGVRRLMPRKATGNVVLQLRLTDDEYQALKSEKVRTKARSLSGVFRAALSALIEETACGRLGLTVPPEPGGRDRRHNYMVSPDLVSALEETMRNAGVTQQQVVRAAMARLIVGKPS